MSTLTTRLIRASFVVVAICAAAVTARAGISVPGFPNDPALNPIAASANYDVVVGDMTTSQGNVAFVWHPGVSANNLKSVLVGSGVAGVSGWNLSCATMISADGGTICGWGVNPASASSPWMAENLPADVNLDWNVDIFDINMVSANWGGSGPKADTNGDGHVDIFDINSVSSSWGQSGTFSSILTELPPQPSNGTGEAPEPATILIWSLFGIGLFAAARWRRRFGRQPALS
jgi:hypothetical protein